MMESAETGKQQHRVRFITNILYWAVILALVYFILKYFIPLVMPFFIATILAALARPLAKFLSSPGKERFSKDGKKKKLPFRRILPYNAAAILSIVVLLLVVAGLISLIVVPLVNYLIEKAAELPAMYTQTLKPGIDALLLKLDKLPGELEEPLRGILESATGNLSEKLGSFITEISGKAVLWVTSFAGSLPNVLLKSLITLIATVFITLDFDRIGRFFGRNLPGKTLQLTIKIKNSLVEILWSFFRSYFLIFLITTAEISIGLLLIGKSHPLLIGLLIAIFDAFPVVGSGMILLPWSVITIITSGVWSGLGLFILYLVVVIARQIIEPKIVGKQVGLRPIITLVCMFVGSKLFGALGLFGLPITAAIIVDLNTQGTLHLFNRDSGKTEETECAQESAAAADKEKKA